LSKCSDQEEHVEEKFELIVEYLWNKGKNVVFCVLYQIVLVVYRINNSLQPNVTLACLYFAEKILLEALFP
jgi:hypothetical protein